MVPVPYVFGYFGPHLRARSKFGYAAYFKKLEEQKELQAAADAKRKTQIEHKNNLLIVPLSNLKCHQNPRKLLLKSVNMSLITFIPSVKYLIDRNLV